MAPTKMCTPNLISCPNILLAGMYHLTAYERKLSLNRFAAKEAIRKACDHLHKDVRGLHKIIILPIKSGHENKQSAPPQGLILDHFYEEQSEPSGSKVLSGEFTDSIEESHRSIEDLDGQLCEVSISHDNDMATAIALVPSMQKMTSGIGQEIVQDACGRVSPSQEGLQQGHALLSSVHSGDQHAISLVSCVRLNPCSNSVDSYFRRMNTTSWMKYKDAQRICHVATTWLIASANCVNWSERLFNVNKNCWRKRLQMKYERGG